MCLVLLSYKSGCSTHLSSCVRLPPLHPTVRLGLGALRVNLWPTFQVSYRSLSHSWLCDCKLLKNLRFFKDTEDCSEAITI